MTAPAAAPAQAPAEPRTVAEQLGARLTTVRGLGAGRHVLSVPLDPERLGPVRVVAHITADAVRVELVGSTEASRDALRGALGDLRRDLASAGLTVELGLGDRQQQSGHGDRPSPHPGWEPSPDAPPAAPAPHLPTRAARGLDLLA